MTYQLYWADVCLGEVTDIQDEELTVHGRLDSLLADATRASPEAAHLAEFVRLTEETCRLADAVDDPRADQELVERNRQLAAYIDLAESPQWHVTDPSGGRRPILCPLFREGGAITWRWRDE